MNEFAGMIDFHAHILPGADHGSDSLETTEKQLKLLNSAGVEKVVATPHFYPNSMSVASFLKRREKCSNALSKLPSGDYPRIYLGAEVLVCPGLDRMPELEKLCIKGTNVILLEMPFYKWNEALYEAVYNISNSDLTVVMAHIGRYPLSQSDRLLNECNVSVQLNGENASTYRGRKRMMRWIEAGVVSAFGSDIHGTSKKYPKNLSSIYSYAGEKSASVIEKSEILLKGAEGII